MSIVSRESLVVSHENYNCKSKIKNKALAEPSDEGVRRTSNFVPRT